MDHKVEMLGAQERIVIVSEAFVHEEEIFELMACKGFCREDLLLSCYLGGGRRDQLVFWKCLKTQTPSLEN
jgi:hypothetical protein